MVFKDGMNLGEAAQEKLDWLANISPDPGGGVTRLLFTPEWVESQKSLAQLFQKEGLVVNFDSVGNLFGRLEGTTFKDETILTGSHVDTVTNGGMYDGQYGIIAGFLALKYLKETYGAPLRNIEVVSMAEEEGSRFPYTFWGSKNIVGRVDPEELRDVKDSKGVYFEEAMHLAGFDFKGEKEPVRDDLKAFLEIHVEQGNVLEVEQMEIGIVEHIVGQSRFTITVLGQANHAGTTPMSYRTDAFNAASRMAVAINDLAIEYGEPLVATIGSMMLEPNVVNVIPNKVVFSVDVRHVDKDTLVKYTTEMTEVLEAISTQVGTKVNINKYLDEDPVPMDQGIVEVIREQCIAKNLKYKMMHSGAGHDSQIIALTVPTAMIFVPSRGGLSHSPNEFTEEKALGAGVSALISSLYEMGYTE